MAAIRLPAMVTEDHQLIVKVPEDIPVGQIELLLELSGFDGDSSHFEDIHSPIELHLQLPPENTPHLVNAARDAARAKLATAGLLGSAHRLPPNTSIPTDVEVLAAGILPPGARPSEELIDEDRNEG